jgi:hypothetical protein
MLASTSTGQSGSPTGGNSNLLQNRSPALEDLDRIEQDISRLKRFQELQKTMAQLQEEIRERDQSLQLGYNQSHTSPQPPSKPEIWFRNLPVFTIDYTLQKREDWLRDMEYLFRGAPTKYAQDSFKIIAAISHMESTCRQRWYRYTEELTKESCREAEDSWPIFKEWTLTLIRNVATIESDVMTRLEKARQRPNEDPREFHACLDALDQHFPRQAEKERALVFFSKLDLELRLYIQRHLLELPDNRDRMVTVATHYHSLLSMQQPKRKREESGRTQERNQSKRPQRSFWF